MRLRRPKTDRPHAPGFLAGQVGDSFLAETEPTFQGRRVLEVDGRTIPLAPEPELQKGIPRASNQYGEGGWPVA